MLLYGKPVSDKIENDITSHLNKLRNKSIDTTVAVIRMGENPDDIAYERMIRKKSERLGITFVGIALDIDASQFEVECAVRNANFDREIHGILLLKPFPKHIYEEKICSMLSADKDIDGVTTPSAAHIYSGTSDGFYPCTAEACLRILDHYNIDLEGKDIVVIGRSLTIGRPVSMLLLDKNATVTICHSKTKDLQSKCSSADILISSIGKAEFLTKEYLKKDQIIIDVGINISSKGELVGDIKASDADSVETSYTPVPGGVGAVTSSLLLWHTVLAAYKSIK